MKVLIREGLYSPEEIADLLLLSVGDNRLSARKVLLSLPKHPKPRANELAMYLAAYGYQRKMRAAGKRCADQTALMKVWGGGGRSPWNKLRAKGRTLEQITRPFRRMIKLVKTAP